MKFSALNVLLTYHPRDAASIAGAIEAGELAVGPGLEAQPALLARFFQEAARIGGEARNAYQQAGQMQLARVLIAHGADPWAVDNEQLDAFDRAISLGNASLVDMIAALPSAPQGLHQRAPRSGAPYIFQSTNNAPLLKAMLRLGFDPQATNASRTLLHEARNPEVVQVLLAHGLDPAAKTDQGLDVQAYWDKQSLTAAVRAEMEAALRQHAPQDPTRAMRDFSTAVMEVGVPAAKQRLLAAGVDPASAELEGFSIPELVVAEALRRGLKHVRVYHSGNEQSHKKWRKTLLSVARHCQVDTWNGPRLAQLQDMVSLLDQLDYHLSAGNKPRSYIATPKTGNKKKPAPPADTTREDLRAAIGLDPQTVSWRGTDTIARWAALIDRMVQAKLVDNGSEIAAWVLQANLPAGEQRGSWSYTVGNEPLMLCLAKQATRGAFDPQWQGKHGYAHVSSMPQANLRLPLTLPDHLADKPNGVGAFACLLAVANDPKSLARWLNIQIERHEMSGELPLTLDDPWLAHGTNALCQHADPERAGIGQRLVAMAQARDLHMGSQPSANTRRGPRL